MAGIGDTWRAVTIALAAKNAATQAFAWNVDNIIVLGQVR
jgi:hypothetical protein